MSIEYKQNDFSILNNAINDQQLRLFELLKNNRHLRYRSWSRIFINIAIALGIMILALSMGYWLIKEHNIVRNSSASISLEQRQDRKSKLSKIINNQTISVSDGDLLEKVSTNFTVFSNIDIPTGEGVVTGKKFKPDNLLMPYYQYCYIHQLGFGNKFDGLHIAHKENGAVSYLTVDPEELDIAKRYCRFD